MKMQSGFRFSTSGRAIAGLCGLALGCVVGSSLARADGDATATEDGYFEDWFKRVDAIQAEQPHWMTPVATVTPRLEEELRFDTDWEQLPHNGARLINIDGGKGLELIPWENIEVLLNAPPYEERSWNGKTSPPIAGWGDWPAVTVKYRLASANEQNGNYIVTAFLGISEPSGLDAFTSHTATITPTIAAGKGWGDFDIQSTLGETFPTVSIAKTSNQSVAWNTTFQYHVGEHFWPEFEVNYTYWPTGPKTGWNQVLLTPGIVFGRFPLVDRTKLIAGIGYQMFASPATPTYNNNLIFTARLAF